MPSATELRRQRDLIDARALLDREPAPAPFAVGTRVRYVGPSRPEGYTMRSPPLERGATFTVKRTHDGLRGDLSYALDVRGRMLWWDDAHRVPVLNVTTDGFSVVLHSPSRAHLIRVDDLAVWEIIA